MTATMKPVRFGLTGIANTLAGLCVIFAAKAFLGAGDVLANALGYAVGLGVSFTLNRRWTFGHRGSIGTAAARFLLVQCMAYLANLAAVLTLINAGANTYVAQAAGVPVFALIGYFGCARWVFTDEDRSPPADQPPQST